MIFVAYGAQIWFSQVAKRTTQVSAEIKIFYSG